MTEPGEEWKKRNEPTQSKGVQLNVAKVLRKEPDIQVLWNTSRMERSL